MSNKDFLFFSILTFITIFFWTIFEAYHIYQVSHLPKTLQIQIEQITPTLDREVIGKLRNRYDEESLPINITPTTVSRNISTPTP